MLSMQDFLKKMAEMEASDFHLVVGRPPLFRVDGELASTNSEALTSKAITDLVYSILTKEQIDRFEKDKELDFSYGLTGISRYRVNVYRQRGSVGVAIRHIPFVVPTIEELGLPPIIKKFADHLHGLVLITGPTGCGKSTTLAAVVEYINNKNKCHIVSIEDPIEYLHQHKQATINQREVGSDTKSFAEALRHVVRQDPNIIMIGEMRDLETIHSALTLAETGHLILATLHTSDAVHSISRIVDVFPPHQQQQIKVQLSMVLIGVIVQQLIPKKDDKGRVLACEVMNVNSSIQNLIRENNLPQIYSCIQTGRKFGMQTMNQSLADLCNNGEISLEEAYRRTLDRDELDTLIKK